jgi:hypothetical protein
MNLELQEWYNYLTLLKSNCIHKQLMWLACKMTFTAVLAYLKEKSTKLKLLLQSKSSSVVIYFDHDNQLENKKNLCDTSFHESIFAGEIL